MSENWVCSKCRAYNHPRRQVCWRCRTPIQDIAPSGQPSPVKGRWSRLLPILAMTIVLLIFVALLGHRWFLATNAPSRYELNWKIEEGRPIAYSATMQITNSYIAVDFGKLFDTDQLEQEENFSLLAAAFANMTATPAISFSLPAYSVVSILEKNPHNTISVRMVLSDVVPMAEYTPQNIVEVLGALVLTNMQQRTLARGEITPGGVLTSTYIIDRQQDMLTFFFGLPGKPVQVGDVWRSDLECLEINSSQFVVANHAGFNEVTFTGISRTLQGETVAVLDYKIAESMDGEQTIPFLMTEPTSASLKCDIVGRGQFLIEQGRWKELAASGTLQITGIVTATITQDLTLLPLDAVPELTDPLDTFTVPVSAPAVPVVVTAVPVLTP